MTSGLYSGTGFGFYKVQLLSGERTLIMLSRGGSGGVVYAKFPVFPLKSMLKVQGENSTELLEVQI